MFISFALSIETRLSSVSQQGSGDVFQPATVKYTHSRPFVTIFFKSVWPQRQNFPNFPGITLQQYQGGLVPARYTVYLCQARKYGTFPSLMKIQFLPASRFILAEHLFCGSPPVKLAFILCTKLSYNAEA